MTNLSVIGLGKLGLPLALSFAKMDLNVLGVDKNTSLIESLKNGDIPFFENNLQELFLSLNRDRIDFSTSIDQALRETNVSIILVNTQLGNLGYSRELVEKVIYELAQSHKKLEKDYHLLVISSTVPPGTCAKLVSLYEETSGKKEGKQFGLVYIPDFVKLGSVLYDFSNPEFVIIGANSRRDFDLASDIWGRLIENRSLIEMMNFSEAEIAKISLNAYLVQKISFANFLSLICNDKKDVNLFKVLKTVGLDRRISPSFFRPGTPYGGTCFPRDVDAFIAFAKANGFDPDNMEFAKRVNDLLMENIFVRAKQGIRVGILGLSFKEGTTVLTDSPSMKLAHALNDEGVKVMVYDNLLEKINNVPSYIKKAASLENCIEQCDTLILMHVSSEYKTNSFIGKRVIDPWYQLWE